MVDDLRLMLDIAHVLKTGYGRCDVPREYGPPTIILNRFHCWSQRRFWPGLLEALAEGGAAIDNLQIDSAYLKA